MDLALIAALVVSPGIAGALVYLSLSRVHAREIEVYGRLLADERGVSKEMRDRLMARDLPEYVAQTRPRSTGVRLLTDKDEKQISERRAS